MACLEKEIVDKESEPRFGTEDAPWQFSLRQCLVAIALLAGVCAAYRIDPILGWVASWALIVPTVLVLPTRGVLFPGFFTGACVSAAALIPVVAVVWSKSRTPIEIVIHVAVWVLMGATLGATVNLMKHGRDGSLVVLFLFLELLALLQIM